MRTWTVLLVSALLALTLAPVGWGATSAPPVKQASSGSPASFEVEGKVMGVSKGGFSLSVTEVRQGNLRKGARLQIQYTARTRFTQAGKATSSKALKAGETVRVLGTILRPGKRVAYRATQVTILQSP
ncbi:MAG: hypothetical protein QN193_02875 [Armatimonadota bacterium]|nr:hypothetical protein [Armatimonadota bacterium]MDR7444116.1 hypothetical protein [Armatimonadota bacterium]MDR7569533.1 hypothetical protein [Armatimonadota bacterium]MDR7613565.1 hypothetical protein [Armatimonadota bacterium]